MSRFRPNPNAVRELEAETAAAMRFAAEEGRKAVHSAALPFARTRYFAKSLTVKTREGKPAIHSTDNFAHLIEFGSRKNPAYAPFRRGLRAIGIEVRDDLSA